MPIDVREAFRQEIAEQPEALHRLAAAYRTGFAPKLAEAAGAFRRADRPILWTGMGASLFADMTGAYTLSMHGRAAVAISTSEWLHYARRSEAGYDGRIVLSTSGESGEIVALIKAGPMTPSIHICNTPDSFLWKAPGCLLPMVAGPEDGNATKTYANACALAALLSYAVLGQNHLDAVDRCADLLSRWMEENVDCGRRMAGFLGTMPPFLAVTGRGPAVAGAMMGALTLSEMLPIHTLAEPAGEYRHGTLISAGERDVAIILTVSSTAELCLGLARDALRRGVRVILITDAENTEDAEGLLCVGVPAVDEPFAAITTVLPLQLLALTWMDQHGTSYVRQATTME